ncbi:MAG TPA: RNA degradosome polyphosphate kinase [Ruminiclostridium sp.]
MSDQSIGSKYINRELSWLEFNIKVLDEARDNSNPLFERLKFLFITCANLDEFFMVRVAPLYEQVIAGISKTDISGLTPKEQIQKILDKIHDMFSEIYSSYNDLIKNEMQTQGIFILQEHELNAEQKTYIENYYQRNVYPVLTPMVVDQGRPFPLILNKTFNIAILLQDKSDLSDEDPLFATVQVPSVLARLIELPSSDDIHNFVLLEDVIKMNLDTLFTGHNIISTSCYRITRNADLTMDEEGSEDLLLTIENSLKQRKWGAAARLEVESNIEEQLLRILEDEVEVSRDKLFTVNGPVDLTYLIKFYDLKGFDNLKYQPNPTVQNADFVNCDNIFEVISKKDILIHHPFQSFDPIIEFVRQAANDPEVLAIKQTLYRVSGKSPIIEALVQAAENGKQVTVLVELKARFDEQNNIIWAKRLEKAGCHVIYGLVGLKTHCKVLLVVRREENGLKRYVHMGTGNYNDVTAKIYTDLGLFTSNPYMGADASALFNMLSGYSEPTNLYKTAISPLNMREKVLKLIKIEEENAKKGKKAIIIAKMNSLVDKQIIDALYSASSAGVQINLIVRGICCLRPGIPGVSENISVRSIVGRYLEHSRIFYFYSGGAEQMFLSSADWMNRNLDRRVELLFIVENEEAKEKIQNILSLCLKDNVKARVLNTDGTYSKLTRKNEEEIDSQQLFYKLAEKDLRAKNQSKKGYI